MTLSIQYSEKFVEEMIKDFPSEFLGEDLVLEAQQPALKGFRPDLIFRRRDDSILIVEVQIDALDRAHLYRSLEYRDLYKAEYPEKMWKSCFSVIQ